ncbi:MAG: adenylate kinase [Bacteroidales bacterium]|nr:adenylate kinase [Bacteroidales bacterium]
METENENSIQHCDDLINIIICGAPGSGKGTQSDLIIKKYNLKHISSGDILRKEIEKGTKLGKEIDNVISKGQLVEDEIITKLVETEIDSLDKKLYKGIILDGYPRTLSQAKELEKIFRKRGTCMNVLIYLQVEEEELISRLLNRGKTSGRSDDNLETIQKRLIVYENQTKPVVDFYKSIGKYANIHGTGSLDEIFERVSAAIDKAV